tara:strand:+ start:3063 stop:5738 length:2676 start_codon:yes stop_codon:yes gene_type:complete
MKKLLIEGPVGHMWHPFDLDSVQTGKDLLSVFQNEVVEYINSYTPSIKIDGINGPIRLITNEEGEREFAIDRLSTSPLDIRGVTADRLRERFEKAVLQALDTDEEITIPLHKLVAMGVDLSALKVGTILTITHRKKNKKVAVKRITSGHGFVNDGGVALRALNGALNAAPADMEIVLKELGMWDNPSICLNNDIVHESSKGSGQVNAVKYDEDFIAFHGLNEIFVPEGKKARKTKEIKLTDAQKVALSELVEIINQHNPVEGFRALSPFDTVALKGEVDIDYSPALEEAIEIKMDDQNAVAKSIGQWLADPKIVKPSYDEKYTFADGKKRSYFSKANYVSLIPDQGETQYSVRELLSPEAHPQITEDDYYKFASAAIFYHATRLLGRQVLLTLVNKSEVGNQALTSHEGVVMRSANIFGIDKPIKITGDFIRDGMAGGISQVMVKESIEDAPPQEVGDEEEEQEEVNTRGTKTVAIMPGSFKPPHMGHLQMAEHLSNIADEVLIFVSSPVGAKRLLPFSRSEITYDKAMELWRLLLKGASGNIKLVESNDPSPSPITALGDLMLPAEEREHYKDVEFFEEDYDKFYLGMSEKEKDDPGSMKRFEMYNDNPRVKIDIVPAFNHSPDYGEAIARFSTENTEAIMALNQDIEAKGLELAASLVSSRAAKKLPANPNLNDYLKALSQANRKKVAKFMKSTPNHLDKANFSATDLRLLLDLKAVYKMPVEELLKDFVGQNVSEYLRIIFGSGDVNESINLIQKMVREILLEQLNEMSAMAGGAVEGGGSNPDKKKKKKGNSIIREEDEEVNEAAFHPSELPIENPRASSTITVTVIPSSKHKATGVPSDAKYKKAISDKFKFGIAKANTERAPYYDEGDIITDLVEKVLRNIIRAN